MRAAAFVWILGATLGLGAQANNDGAKPAPAAGPLVPAGATQVDANTWSWRDAQGTEWTFRKTPFGVSRYRAQDVNRATPVTQKNDTKVTDLGSAWRFVRETPFGPEIWEKKKTAELTEQERALVNPVVAPAPSPVAAQGK